MYKKESDAAQVVGSEACAIHDFIQRPAPNLIAMHRNRHSPSGDWMAQLVMTPSDALNNKPFLVAEVLDEVFCFDGWQAFRHR